MFYFFSLPLVLSRREAKFILIFFSIYVSFSVWKVIFICCILLISSFFLVTFPIYLSKWWNLCDLAPGACIFIPPLRFLCCLCFFFDQNCIRCIENTYFCVEIINQHEMCINMPSPEAHRYSFVIILPMCSVHFSRWVSFPYSMHCYYYFSTFCSDSYQEYFFHFFSLFALQFFMHCL